MSQQGSKRSHLGKNVATSAPTPSTERWPRPQGKAFNLPPHMQPTVLKKEKAHTLDGYFYRATSEKWLPYHSIFYNGLLNVTFDPTRVLSRKTLEDLKILKPVSLLLRNMGLGNIAYESYDLYTDLARQFLATCEVIYDDDCNDPAAGRMTFMCQGRRYWLTLDQLACIFEFDISERARAFDFQTLGKMGCFWNSIAFGELLQSDLKISRIRNPILRIVAKALGHTVFCKKEPGSVRQDELMMLFLGLGDEVVEQADFRGALGELHRVHMGAYFAEILAGRKYKGLGVTKEERIEPVGSLITPILQFCRVELPEEYMDKRKGRLYIDHQYLSNARICKRKVYQWLAPRGVTRYCQLPKTDWTHLRTWEQIQFELPESERCTADGTPLAPIFEHSPEPQHAPPPPPPFTETFAHAADGQYCAHGTAFPPPEPIIEDFPEEYYAEMEPLPAGATFEAWRAHSDIVQQKQTGILRRILRALTKVKWTPPPACCSNPEDVHAPVPSPVPADVSAEASSGDSSHGGGTERMSGASSSGSGPPRRRPRYE